MPSGTLWSKYNLGSNDIYDNGKTYAFGAKTEDDNTFGINDPDITEAEMIAILNKAIRNNVLTKEYDIVSLTYGNEYRMPTRTDFEELSNNTTKEMIIIDGVRCLKMTSNINGETLIFPDSIGVFISTVQDGNCIDIDYYGETDVDINFNLNFHSYIENVRRCIRPVRTK